MRYLSVAWLLPLLLFSQSAEAARISFASDNCGTPPLLGLEFQVLATGGVTDVVTGSTVACPDAAVGTIVDPGGAPLYGSEITSIGFSIVPPNPVDILVAFPEGRPQGSENYLDFGQGQFFPSVTSSFVINDDDQSIELMSNCSLATGTSDGPVLCRDLKIFVQGFEVGTTFRITSVNGIPVPEPATLALLGVGLAAAAVRRRRVIAGKWASPPGP